MEHCLQWNTVCNGTLRNPVAWRQSTLPRDTTRLNDAVKRPLASLSNRQPTGCLDCAGYPSLSFAKCGEMYDIPVRV
jgi:hypothetical protein